MPELPEVQTTVSGLQKVLPRLAIRDVWSDLPTKKVSLPYFEETLKSASFFSTFKREVAGARVLSVERRAKNILINLSSKKTILIHMKMTGHLLYGKYAYDKKTNSWSAKEKGALQDPFNAFLHVVFALSNGKHLVLSDMRKFAKVTLLTTKEAHTSKHLAGLGPEPLEKTFGFTKFLERISLRSNGRIKTVLMDQSLISGIGNIYSDEALWLAGIHPEERVALIPKEKMKLLYTSVRQVLKKGIDFKGDSTSDYRNIDGNPGKFSHQHNAYRRTGKPCGKAGCKGVILRKVVGGRSAHFCSVHQKLGHY
jgi:formamidopyrimidine-DNA glycosylase